MLIKRISLITDPSEPLNLRDYTANELACTTDNAHQAETQE